MAKGGDLLMLGQRLIQLRNMKNLTQQQVADDLKMSRGTYGHYEIGRREPDFDTLEKLATYFGVTTDYLLGRQAVNHTKNDRNFISRKYTDKEYELLEAIKDLSPDQLDAVITVAKAMAAHAPAQVLKTKSESNPDSIADIPYWHLRLQALRKERGLTIEEAASQIDPFFTVEKLQAYEDGREVVEPKYQDKLGKFYNVSWAFISGRTNKRLHDAGPAIGSLEAAHRTDDPTQPLPLAAERRVNILKKKRGLYVEEEGEDKKE